MSIYINKLFRDTMYDTIKICRFTHHMFWLHCESTPSLVYIWESAKHFLLYLKLKKCFFCIRYRYKGINFSFSCDESKPFNTEWHTVWFGTCWNWECNMSFMWWKFPSWDNRNACWHLCRQSTMWLSLRTVNLDVCLQTRKKLSA